MSRTRRLLVVAVAWAVPLALFVTAFLLLPSDGTTITSTTATLAPRPWDEGATVVRTWGDGPLRPGDRVLRIDGREVGDWLAAQQRPERRVGDLVGYEVERSGAALRQILTVNVTLARYPVRAALQAEPAAALLVLLLLAAGALAFWRRPDAPSARAFLAATALLPACAAAAPWGVGAIGLATARGTLPHAAGELLATVGLGALLVSVLAVGDRPWRWRWCVAGLVPLVGYLGWLAVAVTGSAVTLDRAQVVVTLLGPALVTTVPALVVAGLLVHRTAVSREEQLATRMVLLTVVAGAVLWGLVELLPRLFAREPVVPRSLLGLVVLPLVLAGLVVAVTRYRVAEIEPAWRRTLVQGAVVAVMGTAFVALVRGVDLASDVSGISMLVGALGALLLLPVAVALQRLVRRVVYGDRDFPGRIVAELRRLDPVAAPEETLREMLSLLARGLDLSYAAVEVDATDTSPAIRAATGAPHGNPVTVDLAVGETVVGRLVLDVDPGRDPFGPGDRRLLQDVGSQVGVLVRAVSLNRALQGSRQHLVAAREEERRRIRRDLHDGLGPSLATLAMRLEEAQELVAREPSRAEDVLTRLADLARDQISEVRRLVHGLRPPVLDQLGLVSALRQHAVDGVALEGMAVEGAAGDEAGGAKGGPRARWTVEATDDVEPLPAAVEVAAYRIALEAVTNAAHHSGAASCTVSMDRVPGGLHLVVRDTGSGLVAGRAPGVGMVSMRERAEELGGTFSISSTDAGTTVDVVLPVPAPAAGEG